MPSTVSKSRLIPAAILAILVYGMIAAMLGTLLPQLATRFNLTEEQKRLLRELAQTFGDTGGEPQIQQEKGLFGKLKDALGG